MNWGNKLLLVFIVFGLGMGYLVYRSMNTDFELVEKDYYKAELRYQQVIDASNQANQLSSPVNFEQTENGISVQLPAEMKNKTIAGEIFFYCAYDGSKDKKFTIQADTEGRQLIPLTAVLPGNYTVKIDWNVEGKRYYSEKLFSVL